MPVTNCPKDRFFDQLDVVRHGRVEFTRREELSRYLYHAFLLSWSRWIAAQPYDCQGTDVSYEAKTDIT